MNMKSVAAVIFASSLTMGANASIQTQESVSVPVHPSAVQSSQGQQALYAQLKRAAKQVCGTTVLIDAGSLRQVSKNKSCYQDTLARAAMSAGLENVSQL